jgi:hypothetical protein
VEKEKVSGYTTVAMSNCAPQLMSRNGKKKNSTRWAKVTKRLQNCTRRNSNHDTDTHIQLTQVAGTKLSGLDIKALQAQNLFQRTR